MLGKQILKCEYCNQYIDYVFEEFNIITCSNCKALNKVKDGVILKHNDFSIEACYRLQKQWLDLTLQQTEYNTAAPVLGIIEMSYNEGVMHVFFTHQNTLQVYVHFEYAWYIANLVKEPIVSDKVTNIKAGDFADLFVLQKSFIINKEKLQTLAYAGNVQVNVQVDKTYIIEHTIEDKHFLTFLQGEFASASWHLQPIQAPILNKPILHREFIFVCPSCQSENHIISFPNSRSFICKCKRAYAIASSDEVVFERKMNNYVIPYLELGSKCLLDDVNYTLIGHVQKIDKDEFTWNEFTCWNDAKGFLYLSEYNGHWIKLEPMKSKYYIATQRTKLSKYVYEDGREFDLFNSYKSEIQYASGIFAGNILNDQEYSGVEYVAPPFMWTFEKPKSESLSAFKGESITGKQLQTAFNKPLDLPTQIGIGAVEKRKGTNDLFSIARSFILVTILLIATHIITGMGHRETLLFSQFVSVANPTETKFVTPLFNLDKSHANIEIKLYSPLDNAWLENEYEIINSTTGEVIHTEQGIEHYTGYEGGESWSEGSSEDVKIISYLPKGKYQISITTQADSFRTPSYYHIEIKYDVSMTKNLIMILLLLAIPTLIYYLYNYHIEVQRWSNSNYSPYETN